MERPLAWVARRGIRLYISQILEAEETLARGDHIVEEMRREPASAARRRTRGRGSRPRANDKGPDFRQRSTKFFPLNPLHNVKTAYNVVSAHANARLNGPGDLAGAVA